MRNSCFASNTISGKPTKRGLGQRVLGALLFLLALLQMQLALAAVTLVPATGGTQISTTTSGGTYTALTGPVLSEANSGEIGTGWITLNAPTGFEFDTSATVLVVVDRTATSGGGGSNRNINNVNTGSSLTATVSQFQISVQITAISSNGVDNVLTWQGIRVRPRSANAGLQTGNILRTTGGGYSTLSGLSNTANWGTLTEVYPAPTLTSLSPNTKTVGSAAFTMTINGSNFYSGAQVTLGGANRTTTFVSSTQLTAQILVGDMASAGTFDVVVTNPSPNAGPSSALSFTVTNPAPTLTSISPTSVEAGGSNFTLTLTGSNFNANSSVRVGGVARTTTFVSSTQLTTTITASDIAAVTTLSIDVSTPSPGGGTTVAQSLSVISTPSKLAFTVQPSDWTPSSAISPAIVVQVQNLNGVPSSGATNTVTVALNSNPGSSTLSGTTTRTASGGLASFDDLSLNNTAAGYTLIATASGLTSAVSGSFEISNLICFTDPFTSLTNWAVGNESGTFGNPYVTTVNGENRLRLTNATSQISTYAMLQRLFPAAGNKVVVTFKYYSYGGSGADGIAVTLSDASVAPVAGAFGGSLGYAPKLTSQGGEVNHPGFAGGWIGVALDEFGNFSADTEGRNPGGGAPGTRPDSVAVRGSGSGYSGYAYLAGTATLSPGVDNSSGHSYRIIVDHTNGVNAFTSVERDTGGGSNFSPLISAFDAKGFASQAAVPTNWFLSFTGSTGSNSNIHEIANLKVCSPVQQTLSFHHLRLEYAKSALMCGGAAASPTIVVKACGNADCSVLYPGSVTANLTASSGTLSSTSVTFTGGSTTVNLTKSTAGNVTLSATSTSPSTNTAVCYLGSGEIACNTTAAQMVFTSTSACFDAVEPNNAPGSRLLTKLVNTAFNLNILALGASGIDTTSTKQFSYTLVNPNATSGNCTDTNAGLTSWVSATFLASEAGRKTITIPATSLNQAMQNIKVKIRDTLTNAVTCSTDDFSVRPLALTGASAANGPITTDTASALLRAGTDTFAVTTAAVGTTAGATVSGYTGLPKVDTSKLKVAAPGDPTGNATVGVLATSPVTVPPTFQSSTTGTFTYDGVGTLYFDSLSLYDDLWVDHDIANGDCIRNGFNNTLTSGMYGCNFGNVSTIPGTVFRVGRFIPAYFGTELTGTMGCGTITFVTPCPGTAGSTTNMVYSGQPFKAVVKAYLRSGAVATGYDATYLGSRNTTLAVCDTVGCGNTSALNSVGSLTISDAVTGTSQGLTLAASRFTAGVATVDMPSDPALSGERAMAFTFANAATVPTNIYLRASDINGVTSLNTTPASSIEGGLKVISGRARILNATGSEYADTPVTARVEFWQANNQGWIVNPMDNITNATLSTSIVSGLAGGVQVYDVGNKTGLGAGGIATPANVDRLYREKDDTGFKGNFNLWVKAPGTVGTVDITLGVKPWLQYKWDGSTLSSPIGRVGFGTVKRSRVIYRQEMVR